ncbi:MAG: hypothetical protein BV457_02180 [Thermoplasmata archaeon M9B1D]|nr:MAG: hypothetical protein BV457_02180 [Thermoplasmata archaeon M9B1D]PNX50117.1 MAG: hypothetical protein BV456_07790 [Thermoplasmata archaeon M8B2D]
MTLSIKQINSITELHQQGLSIRQIAKKTKKDKNTVNKYINKFKYNKLPQLSLFLDEKLKQKNHVSKPYQPNR